MMEIQEIKEHVQHQMVSLMDKFLAEHCGSRSLDDTTDRWATAEQLIEFLNAGREVGLSPEELIPKAAYFLGFQIYDESVRPPQKIVKLMLHRTPDMTDNDFYQMQNFFWCTVGRAIRDNPDITQSLRAAGIIVTTGDDEEPGQQYAG
jgi:hypothetical protein